MLPIDLCFSRIKHNYSVIYEEKMEKFLGEKRAMRRGEPGRMVESAILEAVERTSERVLKMCALR